MKQALTEKLQQGRPVDLSDDEATYLVEALREAIATALDMEVAKIRDDASIFDELGLDSIDIFDVLDQLSRRFEVPVALEEMPESVLRGDVNATFRNFADTLVEYFRQPPKPLPRA